MGMCDGADEHGGCWSGGGPFSDENGPPRYRCRDCDYDLCHLCYSSRGMQQRSTRKAGAASSSQHAPVDIEMPAAAAATPSFDLSFPVEVQDGRSLRIQWNRADSP